MCGNLLCPFNGLNNKCAKWVDTLGKFVQADVVLEVKRTGHLCWPRKNGVLLLGGYYYPKERFIQKIEKNDKLTGSGLTQTKQPELIIK